MKRKGVGERRKERKECKNKKLKKGENREKMKIVT